MSTVKIYFTTLHAQHNVKIRWTTSPNCSTLSAFLANPYQKQGRFPRAKKRRQYLHQIIDGNRCDLTHVTERRGSPFTLVCTKTTASYEAACKIYARDQENLPRIIALENKTG